jgi:hypothetical protein
MNSLHCRFVLLAACLPVAAAHAQRSNDEPLTIKSQGSFFVGGEKRALPAPAAGAPFGGGEITVNRMYVQYQIPMRGNRHVPVVMVHGCCLSSKTWETTPDGRMGWDEYFVRQDRSVYLADQVSRARSGFDPRIIGSVKSGAQPPSALPNSDLGEPPDRVDGVSLRPDLRAGVSRRPVPDRSRRRAL